jgi:hypothetical protein
MGTMARFLMSRSEKQKAEIVEFRGIVKTL